MGARCLAVDIGGTKLAAGIVDEHGQLLHARRVPTPCGEGADVWRAVAQLVGDVADEAGEFVACGVGCGGPMVAGGEEVSPLNIPSWRGFPLRVRLAELAAVPVFVDNDAKALALAEGWTGEAESVRDYLAMVVSTGVGGGIVLDGRLLDGRLGNAGHIGHVVVSPAAGRAGAADGGVSRPRLRGRPSLPSPAGRPARPILRRCDAVDDSSAGRSHRSPTCSTLTWPSWPAPLPWALAIRSSTQPSARCGDDPGWTSPQERG